MPPLPLSLSSPFGNLFFFLHPIVRRSRGHSLCVCRVMRVRKWGQGCRPFAGRGVSFCSVSTQVEALAKVEVLGVTRCSRSQGVPTTTITAYRLNVAVSCALIVTILDFNHWVKSVGVCFFSSCISFFFPKSKVQCGESLSSSLSSFSRLS